MGHSLIDVEDGQNIIDFPVIEPNSFFVNKKDCHLHVWALTVSVTCKCSQKRREINAFLLCPHLWRMAQGEAYASTHNRNKKSTK